VNEELIKSVSNILMEWNPLGERASSISDLNGYRTEAIDMLASSKILKRPIKKSVASVLSQAFDLDIDESQLNHYSEIIEQIVNAH